MKGGTCNLGLNTIGCFLILEGWMDGCSFVTKCPLPTCITLQLSVLNLIPQRSAQLDRLLRAVLRVFESVGFIIMCPTFITSANFLMIVTHSTALSISLVKITNRRGPNKLCWGTPDGTSFHVDEDPLRTTFCVLCCNQFLIHFSTNRMSLDFFN